MSKEKNNLEQAADAIFLSDDAQLEGEQSITRFVAVDKVMRLQWIDNAKLHDIGVIVQSIIKHGFRDKPSWDANLTNVSGERGAFVEGNGRSEAVFWMYQQNQQAAQLKQKLPYARPRGIKEDVSGAYGEAGLWFLPCEFGLDAESEAAAQAYGLDHNSTTLLGGDFDEQDTWKIYDKSKLARLARRIHSDEEEAVSFDADSLERLEEILALDEPLHKQAQSVSDKDKQAARTLPLDMIYTAATRTTCCIAVQAGLRYGLNSGMSQNLCPYHSRMRERHRLVFIDNNYTAYDHKQHLDFVKEHRPKYATVRDIMSREQCREASVDYYELEQILDWAEELNEFAEHVIVIPKYDCIEQLDKKFMLGYSIPTSHGGTYVDAEKFKGRKIHLLGGSWKRQLEFLDYFGDDVLSVDNNQIHLVAKYGTYMLPDGETAVVGELHPHVNNVLIVALSLSFGNIAYKVSQLYKERKEQKDDEQQSDDAAETDTLDFPI